MKPYYQDEWVTHYCADALSVLCDLSDSSIDFLATDPPYGIGFMGKDWDKALPDIKVWKECLRVLKAGSFAFVMSIPRSDCLSRMVISLEDAGFRVDFTPIYWAYASGFPKAQNIGKAVDKRLSNKREVVSHYIAPDGHWRDCNDHKPNEQIRNPSTKYGYKTSGFRPIDKGNTELEGSYGGFQPKPAVEVIIVAMKPLSEKTFIDQALKNRKGITWLDDGRIPYESEGDYENAKGGDTGSFNCNIFSANGKKQSEKITTSGRFPANLLVSDDVLNDGRDTGAGITGSGKAIGRNKTKDSPVGLFGIGNIKYDSPQFDSGSFSRYFDLDKWAQKTLPFLIVPKASKSEKNRGLDYEPQPIVGRDEGQDIRNVPQKARSTPRINQHPTVKPLKLMSYLITLGSRAGDVILDPFLGSGTTSLACKLLNRKCIGIEIEEKYCEIATKRCSQEVFNLGI